MGNQKYVNPQGAEEEAIVFIRITPKGVKTDPLAKLKGGITNLQQYRQPG